MTSACWGIVIASGKGEKFAPDVDTAFLNIASRPVLTYSLSAFEHCPDIEGIVVVAPKERMESIRNMVHMFGSVKVKKIVAGTNLRQTSVLNGLKALEDAKPDVVVIHDASRPCVKPSQISETIKVARKSGCAVTGYKVVDALKVVEKGNKVAEHLPGGVYWTTVSPQAFKTDVLVKALEAAQKKKLALSDDCEALSLLKGKEVSVVATDLPDVRISSPADLMLAEILLRR